MNAALPIGLSLAFVLLGAWHFYMAIFPGKGTGGAVPTVAGKPLFVPSAPATIGVAVVLLLCAVLILATAGLLVVGIPQVLLQGLCFALTLGLLARAVGDFKHVGFFKRNRGSSFAVLDTFVYSPACLVLGVAVALVAALHGA